MNKEKRVTVYEGNTIFQKIKKFFRNIFSKFKDTDNSSNTKGVEENYNNFKQEIEIKQDEEELRILKLQEDYKNGIIEEENISKEDYKKLLELYDKENKEIKEDIEKDMVQIKNMLEQLKKKN